MLGLKEAADELAKPNSVGWCGGGVGRRWVSECQMGARGGGMVML